MLQILKRLMVLSVIGLATFMIANAQTHDARSEHNFTPSMSPFVENLKLSSSRFSREEDLRVVDPALYIDLHDEDILQFENDQFALYLQNETLIIKVLNKATGYVWSSSIDDPNAGTYTALLSSIIGFEYINISQNYSLRQNVGLNEAEADIEISTVGNKLVFDIHVGGFCATRNCSRFYEDYLEGRYTLEQMINFGFTQVDFGFRFEVSLTETGIVAHIPYDSIFEGNPEFVQLSSLIVFPGLGATKMDLIPGYMVIPDGVGALIRYDDKEGKYLTPFEERFYGTNPGVQTTRMSVTSYPLSMPIFGAVHGVNQHAFIGVVEEGAFSARLLAFPNGAANLKYNLIFTKFDYKQIYRQSFTSDGTGGALRIVKASESDVTVRYDFLSGDDANYVGIGRRYQEMLVSQGILERITQTEEMIPIHLQYLMTDSKTQFIGTSIVTMSTTEEVRQMYDYFMSEGLTNQRVSLLGWNKGGYSGQLPSPVNFERSAGSNRDFESLIDHINEENQVMLVNNYIRSTNGTSRVSYRNDVAQGVNRFKLENTCNRCVYSARYLLYPESSLQFATRDYEDYIEVNAHVLFESLGSMLFSYYDRGVFIRENSAEHYNEIMDLYDGIGHYYYPHAYAYQYVTDFYHTPIYNSQLTYFDDLVPLLPAVLSGHITMFSEFLNFNSLGKEQMLMLIDFGINPSFILTAQRSSLLNGTDIEDYYATQFSSWHTTVLEEYRYINDALRYIQGATMVNRRVVALGVTEVTYDNGITIYVNYTSSSYTDGIISVGPYNYMIMGVSS
ncbi:MAG: DUF5696 domain-containing protein [Candidatus Izemoplasmataceae bacterium]